MEKEQKKLLLVAVSVGVFLLVTITAAIVILTPKAFTEETAFSSSRPFPAARVQPIAEIVTVQPVPEAVQEPEAAAHENLTSAAPVDKNDGNSITINVPKPTTAAVPDSPELSTPEAARKVVTVAPAKPAAAAQPTPSPAAKPAVTAQPTTAVPAVAVAKPAASSANTAASTARPAASTARPAAPARPAPAAQSRSVNDYWVQTGAFTAKIRAEDAKETLASKGIISIIENRQLDGKTWYRVRLGPYTSEKEANYWLALVKSIDGFGESQVRQSVRQQ